MNFLSKLDGHKTKIGGIGLILVAFAELLGQDVVETITSSNAPEFIFTGLMIVAGRDALRKLEGTK